MADPRRPERVVNFKAKVIDPDQLPPDWMALVSLLCGVAGLMLRQKWAAWVAFFCTLSSLTNLKNNEIDVKQIICYVT